MLETELDEFDLDERTDADRADGEGRHPALGHTRGEGAIASPLTQR